MNFRLSLAALLISTFTYSQTKNVAANIPSLDEVSGIWWGADTLSMEPSIRNFKGDALLNRDMTSISWLTAAPYSGGYHTGILKINGEVPRAQLFRWYPYQSLRKAEAKNCAISTNIKMFPNENVIMWQVDITNNTSSTQQYKIEQDLIGFISCYKNNVWPWPYPFPTLKGKTNDRTNEVPNVRWNIGLKPSQFENITLDSALTPRVKSWPSDSEIINSSKYHVLSNDGKTIIIADNETTCFSGFEMMDKPDQIISKSSGGTALWNVSLKPGVSKTIRFILSFDESKEVLTSTLQKHTINFTKDFASVKTYWENRWQQIFQPHNELISGCFPVLETSDSLMKRMYYNGPLTALYLMNTNLPQHKRIYLTGGPIWGSTIVFFWDTAEWSNLFAMADPAMMKEQIKSWVSLDINKYYGKDNYTGKGVGNGYVANYWALFQIIRSYITVSKDYAFLNDEINGKKLIDHLTEFSYNWQKISLYGKPGCTDDNYKLADYGSDPWNLLECVPTYIHIVPSFNIGYVWMMRETAKFYEQLNDKTKADSIKTDADAMAKRVLNLYAGNGTWNSLYPDNKTVEVRHVLDFQYAGRYMSNDFSPAVRDCMVGFVNDELLTNTWMRAQSLKDIAASASDRPDHGPLGAYDGWPAATIDAFTQMGYVKEAFDFYKRIAPITNEGNWAQAHELWGDNKLNKDARVRIPSRGWTCRDAEAGIEFSLNVIKDFFGFFPEINGDVIHKHDPLPFTGTLHHVWYDNKYYTLVYNNGETKMTEEN